MCDILTQIDPTKIISNHTEGTFVTEISYDDCEKDPYLSDNLECISTCSFDDMITNVFCDNWKIRRPSVKSDSSSRSSNYAQNLMGRGKKGQVYGNVWYPKNSLSICLNSSETSKSRLSPRSPSRTVKQSISKEESNISYSLKEIKLDMKKSLCLTNEKRKYRYLPPNFSMGVRLAADRRQSSLVKLSNEKLKISSARKISKELYKPQFNRVRSFVESSDSILDSQTESSNSLQSKNPEIFVENFDNDYSKSLELENIENCSDRKESYDLDKSKIFEKRRTSRKDSNSLTAVDNQLVLAKSNSISPTNNFIHEPCRDIAIYGSSSNITFEEEYQSFFPEQLRGCSIASLSERRNWRDALEYPLEEHIDKLINRLVNIASLERQTVKSERSAIYSNSKYRPKTSMSCISTDSSSKFRWKCHAQCVQPQCKGSCAQKILPKTDRCLDCRQLFCEGGKRCIEKRKAYLERSVPIIEKQIKRPKSCNSCRHEKPFEHLGVKYRILGRPKSADPTFSTAKKTKICKRINKLSSFDVKTIDLSDDLAGYLQYQEPFQQKHRPLPPPMLANRSLQDNSIEDIQSVNMKTDENSQSKRELYLSFHHIIKEKTVSENNLFKSVYKSVPKTDQKGFRGTKRKGRLTSFVS